MPHKQHEPHPMAGKYHESELAVEPYHFYAKVHTHIKTMHGFLS